MNRNGPEMALLVLSGLLGERSPRLAPRGAGELGVDNYPEASVS